MPSPGENGKPTAPNARFRAVCWDCLTADVTSSPLVMALVQKIPGPSAVKCQSGHATGPPTAFAYIHLVRPVAPDRVSELLASPVVEDLALLLETVKPVPG
jgi:hypothetical protein